MQSTLPETHRVLLHTSPEKPLTVTTRSIPQVVPGSALIRVLSVPILPVLPAVLNGSVPYPLSLPLVPGQSCIGRVAAIGPDAVLITPNALVFCDMTIRGRDDPSAKILHGLHGGATPTAKRLMDGEWRDGCLAEYVRVPLENVHVLDEEMLCGKMGYSVHDLNWIGSCLVPFGGLVKAGVKVGETVVIKPATGRFGGAAVTVALAMGAKVVACGRKQSALKALNEVLGQSGRLTTVQLKGDLAADSAQMQQAIRGTGADVYFDFSPPEATDPNILNLGLGALKPGGRCVLMGGLQSDVAVPYPLLMFMGLSIIGKFMFERDDVIVLIKMVETGNMKLGKEAGISSLGVFKLEEFEKALQLAESEVAWGKEVSISPPTPSL